MEIPAYGGKGLQSVDKGLLHQATDPTGRPHTHTGCQVALQLLQTRGIGLTVSSHCSNAAGGDESLAPVNSEGTANPTSNMKSTRENNDLTKKPSAAPLVISDLERACQDEQSTGDDPDHHTDDDKSLTQDAKDSASSPTFAGLTSLSINTNAGPVPAKGTAEPDDAQDIKQTSGTQPCSAMENPLGDRQKVKPLLQDDCSDQQLDTPPGMVLPLEAGHCHILGRRSRSQFQHQSSTRASESDDSEPHCTRKRSKAITKDPGLLITDAKGFAMAHEKNHDKATQGDCNDATRSSGEEAQSCQEAARSGGPTPLNGNGEDPFAQDINRNAASNGRSGADTVPGGLVLDPVHKAISDDDALPTLWDGHYHRPKVTTRQEDLNEQNHPELTSTGRAGCLHPPHSLSCPQDHVVPPHDPNSSPCTPGTGELPCYKCPSSVVVQHGEKVQAAEDDEAETGKNWRDSRELSSPICAAAEAWGHASCLDGRLPQQMDKQVAIIGSHRSHPESVVNPHRQDAPGQEDRIVDTRDDFRVGVTMRSLGHLGPAIEGKSGHDTADPPQGDTQGGLASSGVVGGLDGIGLDDAGHQKKLAEHTLCCPLEGLLSGRIPDCFPQDPHPVDQQYVGNNSPSRRAKDGVDEGRHPGNENEHPVSPQPKVQHLCGSPDTGEALSAGSNQVRPPYGDPSTGALRAAHAPGAIEGPPGGVHEQPADESSGYGNRNKLVAVGEHIRSLLVGGGTRLLESEDSPGQLPRAPESWLPGEDFSEEQIIWFFNTRGAGIPDDGSSPEMPRVLQTVFPEESTTGGDEQYNQRLVDRRDFQAHGLSSTEDPHYHTAIATPMSQSFWYIISVGSDTMAGPLSPAQMIKRFTSPGGDLTTRVCEWVVMEGECPNPPSRCQFLPLCDLINIAISLS